MTRPTSSLRARLTLCIVFDIACAGAALPPQRAEAQGLVKGVEQGAREGNKAAGPVGGVLGGAIGGVVGVFNGVLGVGGNNNSQQAAAPPNDKAKDKQGNAAKPGKATKAAKGATVTAAIPTTAGGKPITVLTQDGAPKLTAEQIVSDSDTYVERIKKELDLTSDQEKNWGAFASAMHYLGHNGAERLNLRMARARRDPPDDIIEQMRNEAQFLVDRATDQRNIADAAEPLYESLNDKQKQTFIDEMVRLSHERGMD